MLNRFKGLTKSDQLGLISVVIGAVALAITYGLMFMKPEGIMLVAGWWSMCSLGAAFFAINIYAIRLSLKNTRIYTNS